MLSGSRRCINSHQSGGFQTASRNLRPALAATVGLMGAYGAYKLVGKSHQEKRGLELLPVAYAASPKYLDSQPSVQSHRYGHCFYCIVMKM